MEAKKLLIAIDGNNLMHRAYYALPPMTSADNTPTGAVFGFLNMLLKLLERDPSHIVVAFDMHGPTFRHDVYTEYKAGRRKTPDDLRPQFPLLQKILRAMGVHISMLERYEADDLLGAYAKKAEQAGMDALLVTGDRDALQLITEHTHVLLSKRGITETIEMDTATLFETYGLSPDQMKDLKGMMGDASDHIPGIPGVGEKTALKLLQEYSSLENILAHANELKGKLAEKVKENAELARMSYLLGVIDADAPIQDTLSDCVFQRDSLAGGASLLYRYQMNAIAKRLPAGAADTQQTLPIEKPAISIQAGCLNDLGPLLQKATKVGLLSLCIQDDALYFAVDAQEEYSVRFTGTLLEHALDPAEVFARLQPLLEDARIKKYCYDAKAWMHLLQPYGIVLAGLSFDAMIVDYLLHANRPAASLEALCQAQFGAHQSAAALLQLEAAMMQELRQKQLIQLYETIELPLVGVLYRMEQCGFRVDIPVLRELSAQFGERASQLEEEIYTLAGERFNILSTKQLGSILFEKLMLPTQRKTKTGYSTDADALDALLDLHPIIAPIQEYRFLTKLRSTFLDGLIAAVSPKDERVHTQFNQNVAATGRISSTAPNLQNIPVRTQLGREIRKAFIPSEGNVLVGADYSQIELRLLAHISGDSAMQAAFLAAGDIHTNTAAEVFGVAPQDVTFEQRSAAKAVNFGIVYGISDFGLSRNLGISRKQAATYIAQYLDRYPGVRAYMQRSVEDGKAQGYVNTLLGRRRELPELKSGNYNMRSFGERAAMNMPIQGTAADIIKLAMVHIDAALHERHLNARLVLQVHDELLLDVPVEEQAICEKLVHEAMENAMQLDVPLLADVRSGHSWYETK